MYKTLIWGTAVMAFVAALVGTIASASQQKPSAPIEQVITNIASIPPTDVPVQPEAIPNPQDVKVAQLSQYLLDAMNTWAKPDSYSAPYDSIAHDIAVVALDPKEPPIWKDDVSRVRTATLLLSLAFWEGKFRAYVDEGRCNDRAWRKTAEGIKLMHMSGSCDNGIARSIWQIHADWGGIVVVDANYDDGAKELSKREWCYASQCGDDDGSLVKPEGFLDRQSAARVALHMARRSIRKNVGLCQYTGEQDNVCPLGVLRYNWAKTYNSKHPFSFSL